MHWYFYAKFSWNKTSSTRIYLCLHTCVPHTHSYMTKTCTKCWLAALHFIEKFHVLKFYDNFNTLDWSFGFLKKLCLILSRYILNKLTCLCIQLSSDFFFFNKAWFSTIRNNLVPGTRDPPARRLKHRLFQIRPMWSDLDSIFMGAKQNSLYVISRT